MVNNNSLPQLPKSESYYDAVRSLDAQYIRGYGSVNNALRRFGEPDRERPFGDKVVLHRTAKFAAFLEPYDYENDTPIDPDKKMSTAIRLGAIAGLELAKRIHGDMINYSGIVVNTSRVIRPIDMAELQDLNYSMGSGFIDVGTRGLELIGQKANNVIEDWEVDVIPDDSTHQLMFRRTCGFIALGAYGEHEKLIDVTNERRRREIEVLEQNNFDQAFKDILRYY